MESKTTPMTVSSPRHDVEAGHGDGDAASAARQQHHGGGGFASFLSVEEGIVWKPEAQHNPKWYQRLLDAGVEDNGIKPVPVEKRTDTRYHNLYTVFATALLCVLPYVAPLFAPPTIPCPSSEQGHPCRILCVCVCVACSRLTRAW